MKTARSIGLFLATAILGAGCYTLNSTTVSYAIPTTWTGTGRGTFASSSIGRGVGLAGQKMIFVPGSTPDGYGPLVLDNPLSAYFPGVPYVLQSYTQTFGVYGEQVGVMVAHATTESGSLDLFLQTGIPSAYGWLRLRPSSTTVWEEPVDAITWRIVELCDVAAITEPSSPDPQRFFASVRARRCLGSCDTAIHGGVVELQLEGTSSWRAVTTVYSLGNAAWHDDSHAFFSDECMPIDVTTRYSDQVGQRLIVADPSADAILMYDAANLGSGPIDVTRTPDATRSPVDVAVLADRQGGTDQVFVAVLWRGSATPELRHYYGTLGGLGDTPHLTETLTSDVRFIQGHLQAVTTTPSFQGNLFTFGNRVIRRTYQY